MLVRLSHVGGIPCFVGPFRLGACQCLASLRSGALCRARRCLTPPSRGLACGQPLTSNVRPPQGGNSRVGRQCSVGSSIHRAEFRLAGGRRENVLPGLRASCLAALVRERVVWVAVALGAAESSTFCGPASGQPAKCNAFRHRQSAILWRVAPWSAASLPGKQPNAKALHRFSIKPIQLACRNAKRSGSSVAFSSTPPAEA